MYVSLEIALDNNDLEQIMVGSHQFDVSLQIALNRLRRC